MRGLTGWGTQDEAEVADSAPIMTQPHPSKDNSRASAERRDASRGTASIALMLLLALALVAAAGALLIGRAKAEPYLSGVTAAMLATLGIFLLFALAGAINL